jgi:hypothetical protein
VRVLQGGGGADLREESLRSDHGSEFRAEDLHRHAPWVPDILGEVDRGHAALAQLAVEAVAVVERGGQALRYGGHAGIVD